MRLRAASISAVFVLLVAACSGSNESTSTAPSSTAVASTEVVEPPEPVGGLLATIGTNRLYTLDRGFGLGLRNVGDLPVTVRELQLVSPLFETVPPVAEGVLLQPGGRQFVLPVPYGEARCEGEVDETFAAVVVVDDGEELQVPVAEDYPGAIGRLHARECAVAHVRELAELRFGDEWTRDGDAVTGELILEQRRPGTSVAIDEARGSVMFTIGFEADGPPVLRVTDDEPMATVATVISVRRCDPHALAESKLSFRFLTWVMVGDDEPVPMEFEPTGAARAALDELLATCQP